MSDRRKGKKSEPRVSVFCRCGAQWHGRFAIKNTIIESHRQRCGEMVSPAKFEGFGHRVSVPNHWRNHTPASEDAGR